MAKKKEHYGVFIIVGIVIVFAVALVYFGGGNVGQAIGKEKETIFCYFDGATEAKLAQMQDGETAVQELEVVPSAYVRPKAPISMLEAAAAAVMMSL